MSIVECSLDSGGGDDDDPYSNAWGAILTTLIIYGALGLVMLIVFERYKSNKQVYASRANVYPHRVPERQALGCCSWIRPLLALPDDEVLKCAGLDAYVLLRFVGMALRLSFAMMIWGLCILIPIYVTGGRDVSSSFGKLTMDNIHQQGYRLWASVISAYLFTGLVLWGIDKETKEFARCRLDFLINGDESFPGLDQCAFTVRVEMLPKELRSDAELKNYFAKLYPGMVVDAVVFVNINSTKLVAQIVKAEATCEALESKLTLRAFEQKKYDERAERDVNAKGYCSKITTCQMKKDDTDKPFEEPTMVALNRSPCCKSHENDEEIISDRTKDAVQQGDGVKRSTFDSVETVVVSEDCCWKVVRAVPHLTNELSKANAEVGKTISGIFERIERIESKALKRIEMEENDQAWIENLGRDAPEEEEEDAEEERDQDDVKSSSGYVTFATKSIRGSVVQVLLSNRETPVEVFAATDPRAVLWMNCTMNSADSAVRQAVVSAAVFFAAIFLFIPLLIFCNVFGDIEQLSKIIPGLDSLEPGSFAYDFITGQLPILLQSALIAMLPAVFKAIAIYVERRKLLTRVDRSVVDRGFGYQLVNIYFTLIGNSLASTMKNIVDEPGCIFYLLGESVPAEASYFIQFILINALFGLTLELSRLVPLILTAWFSHNEKSGGSAKARRRLFGEDITLFSGAEAIPGIILVVILLFTYSVIVPLLSVASFVYFAIAHIVYRYNFLYVYVGAYESGGELFWALHGYTLTGLNFANVTLMGYMVIKEGFIEFVVLLPLLVIVEVFRSLMKSKGVKRSSFLGREAAATLDSEKEDGERVFDPALFRQPALFQGPIEPEPYASVVDSDKAQAETAETDREPLFE